jgi:beta-lactamase class A
VRAARAYLATRPGNVSFAVRTGGRFFGWRTTRAVPSASVLKAMLMVAYLRRGDVRFRPLRAADRALLDPMVRRSDNPTAGRVNALVGDAGLRRLARRAGMQRFRPAGPAWGSSTVDARDQTRFFLRIDRLLPPRHRAYGLRLLRTIVPSQRWGVGEVTPSGWRAAFKGGWGSGSGAVDHQVALLTRGGLRLSVAVMTTANPSHKEGERTLRGVFARLLRGLGRVSAGDRGAAAAARPASWSPRGPRSRR